MGKMSAVFAAVLGLAVTVSEAQTPTGTLAAAGQTFMYAVGRNDSTASITVSGTFEGTIAFEVVGAPGTPSYTVDCATFASPGTAVNSADAPGADSGARQTGLKSLTVL